MKKLNLILGILALVASLALVFANLTLPPESLLFDIGYGNWPWVPPIIFAVIGIILLATAGIGREDATVPQEQPKVSEDPAKAAMNKRFENMAWGFFLIFWGGSMFWPKLVPGTKLPDGLWSIGVGLILLGLNAARYYNKIRMSGFTTVLGIISVLGGIVQLFGVTGLEGAFLLIILGAYLILKPWFEQRQLFGKAEQG